MSFVLRRFFTPNILMLWSVLLGVISGWLHVESILKIANIVSELITSSLRLVSTPIIFVSVIATISGMKGMQEMRILGVKVFKYTLLTTIIAAFVALLFFIGIDPVQQIKSMQIQDTSSQPNYLASLLQMYPSNIVAAFQENNVIGVILFAAALGIASLSIQKEYKESIHQLFRISVNRFLKGRSLPSYDLSHFAPAGGKQLDLF